MEAARLMEILEKEYGIKNSEELDAAVEKSAGINLGIFTVPHIERSVMDEQRAKAEACILQ